MAEFSSLAKKQNNQEEAVSQRKQRMVLQDNRESSVNQRRVLQDNRAISSADVSPPAQRVETSEQKPNNTGLPDQLKAGIESLSGMSMDHVKVHYNSDKPAQLNAHAYAQGSDIHLASGQEKHLPHEAWHVVQQAQGRVKPTMQIKAGVNVNDDKGLEKEADVMGTEALQMHVNQNWHLPYRSYSHSVIVQGQFWEYVKDLPLVWHWGPVINLFWVPKLNMNQEPEKEGGIGIWVRKNSNEYHNMIAKQCLEKLTLKYKKDGPIDLDLKVVDKYDEFTNEAGDISKEFESLIEDKKSEIEELKQESNNTDTNELSDAQTNLKELQDKKEELNRLEKNVNDTYKKALEITQALGSKQAHEEVNVIAEITELRKISDLTIEIGKSIVVIRNISRKTRSGFGALGRAHDLGEKSRLSVDEEKAGKYIVNKKFGGLKLNDYECDPLVYTLITEDPAKKTAKDKKDKPGPFSPPLKKEFTLLKAGSDKDKAKKDILNNLNIKNISPVLQQKVPYDRPARRADRGSGQIAAMGLNATYYAMLALQEDIYKQKKWEWLHIRGAGLGGSTEAKNLVLGTADSNTHMMPIEAHIVNLTHLIGSNGKKPYRHLDVTFKVNDTLNPDAVHAVSSITINWCAFKNPSAVRGGVTVDTGNAEFKPLDSKATITKTHVKQIEDYLQEVRSMASQGLEFSPRKKNAKRKPEDTMLDKALVEPPVAKRVKTKASEHMGIDSLESIEAE